MPKKTAEIIQFVNRKGEKMFLPASATIEDLVKMGITDIRVKPMGSPIRKGYWAARK